MFIQMFKTLEMFQIVISLTRANTISSSKLTNECYCITYSISIFS